MHKHQPPDEWSFLRPDVLTDDDALDTLIAANEVSPEEAALHIDRTRISRPATDPGRAEVIIDPDLGATPTTVRYFDDEEPERGGASPEFGEPDLEEILESQHYAFAPEAVEATYTDPPRAGTV